MVPPPPMRRISPEPSTETAFSAPWLRVQERGLIQLDDVQEAAGMLLGMVASAPRRAAVYGGVPLPSRPQIEARARTCAALFLRGCGTPARKPSPPY
jgi:hypothetical protein